MAMCQIDHRNMYGIMVEQILFCEITLFLDPLVCFQEDHTTLAPQYPIIPHFDPPWLKS